MTAAVNTYLFLTMLYFAQLGWISWVCLGVSPLDYRRGVQVSLLIGIGMAGAAAALLWGQVS